MRRLVRTVLGGFLLVGCTPTVTAADRCRELGWSVDWAPIRIALDVADPSP